MPDLKERPGNSIFSAVGDISLLWLGSVASAGAAFFTQLILARNLTLADYGIFASSFATVTMLAPLAGFGVQPFWLKIFGEEGWGAQRWLKVSLRFVTLTTVLVLVLLSAWALLGPHDVISRMVLLWLMPVAFGNVVVDLLSGKLQLEERYRALTYWQMSPNCLRLLVVFVVYYWVAGHLVIQQVAMIYLGVALTVSVIGVWGLQAMFRGTLALRGHKSLSLGGMTAKGVSPDIREVARHTWPFGLSGLFFLIYYQSDIILLKYLVGPEEAGIYNVAFSVMAAVYLLPSAIYPRYLLPKMHRWATHDRGRFLECYRHGNVAMLMLGLMAAAAVIVFVPWLIPQLFGPSFQSASGLLMILALGAPFRFIATNVGAALVTRDNVSRKVKYMALAALVNIGLNFLLIPSFAARGAAIATVASEIFLLAVYLLGVRWHVFGKEAWVLAGTRRC